jgi:AcrR family transcriptional regulator
VKVETKLEAPRRSPLSRERVVIAATAVADAGGLEGLSMRSLARELGVEAMSLYHWFRNKNELLAGMLDATFVEMERPAHGPDWREDMRSASISAKDVLLRHKWAAKLLGEPMGPSRAQFEWMDGILGRLREAGFSRNMTHHAYHALDSHIVGFVLWVLPVLELGDQIPDLADQVLSSLQDGSLPHFLEHVQEHLEPMPDDVGEFEFGLDLLLDGLERLRVAQLG